MRQIIADVVQRTRYNRATKGVENSKSEIGKSRRRKVRTEATEVAEYLAGIVGERVGVSA